MEFLAKINRLIGKYRLLVGLSVFFALVHTAINLVPALLIREIIGRISAGAAVGAGTGIASWSLGTILVVLVGVYLVRAVAY